MKKTDLITETFSTFIAKYLQMFDKYVINLKILLYNNIHYVCHIVKLVMCCSLS